MKLTYMVDEPCSGKTVKYILKNRLGISEQLVKRLKYNSCIFLNSIPVFIKATVNSGDVVDAVIDFEENSGEVLPEDIPLDILYEDDAIIALNKQPGIVVHPTSTHPSGTIANAVVHYFNSRGLKRKVRPVSRLDRDTSGIILFAMNEYVQNQLIHQMNADTFKKEYIGVVHGNPENEKGTISLPIARLPGSIIQRHAAADGAPSITHYEVIERFENASLLSFRLETGRTHQIRVHCQAIGHSLIGDTLYPPLPEHSSSDIYLAQQALISRQALHSIKVGLIHPTKGSLLELKAPVTPDIVHLLEILRK